MAMPEFTESERYSIDTVKSSDDWLSNRSIWTDVILGIILAIFSIISDIITMLATAFFLVCGFRSYEETFQRKWMPYWQSIIAKYEEASSNLGNK